MEKNHDLSTILYEDNGSGSKFKKSFETSIVSNTPKASTNATRRKFLRTSLFAASAVAVLGPFPKKEVFAGNEASPVSPLKHPESFPDESHLERMRN